MLSPIPEPPRPLFTGAYLRTLLVQFSFGCAYSAFLLLPKYLKTELGASAEAIGSVASAALIAAALLSPFVGLSARYAKRTTLLAVALVLEGVAGVSFVFVETVGPAMYAIRAAQGLAWVIVFNVTATVVADFVPKNRMSQAIGMLGVSMLVTNAIAPALAEPIAARFGWAYVFAAPAIVMVVAVPLARSLPEPSQTVGESALQALRSTRTPRLLSIYFVSLVMGAGIGTMFTFTQPYALIQGASRVGDFFFGYVAAALFVRTALSWVADRHGSALVAALSLLSYTITVGLTAIMTPATMALLGAGLGVSHGFLYPAVTACGLSDLSSSQRSVFMGWLSGSFNAGAAGATLLLGSVADRHGYPPVFIVTALLLLSASIPFAHTHGLLRRPRRVNA